MDKKTSLNLEKFSKTLGHIYEAGLDADKWPVALLALSEDIGADKAQMIYIDQQDYMISFACGYGFDPYSFDIGAGKFRRYLFEDPVAQYGFSNLDEVFSDRRVIDPKTLQASGMQKNIRDPADMKYLLTVFLQDGTDDLSGFCFFRNKDQKAFDERDEQLLTTFKDHLKRSTLIHKSMAGTSHLEALHNAVLDHLDSGILILNDLHDVLVCNKLATKIITDSGILKIKSGRLVCASRRDNSLLHEAIDDALIESWDDEGRRRVVVRLRGINQSDNIIVVSTPLQIHRFEENIQSQQLPKAYYTAKIPHKRNVMLTICNPSSISLDSEKVLQKLFGLTPAEAALTDCLADDLTLVEAAEKLGRSVGTARIQLQSIFGKTDTNRQSSLIKLISSIPI